jgi:integrase
MAKLSRLEDKRSGVVRYRLRYTVHFPDGSRIERSRRYGTIAIARAKLDVATVLESRTRQLRQTPDEITVWQHENLLSREEAKLLNLASPAATKTLRQAMDEYRATWEVSPEETATRDSRLDVIAKILGPDTPIGDLNYGHGELLKTELRRRGPKGLKIVTIGKYLQDLKRCFRHQVRLGILPYNPFAELSRGRVPASEKPKQTRLTSAEVTQVLNTAATRIEKEEGWPVLHGWLLVFLLMLFGTGLRRKEAMLAKWEDIDWEIRSLRVPAENAKDGEERRVGLGRRLYRELSASRKEEGFILPHFYPTTITRAVTQHFAKCGFKMRLHDTRHTYATLLQEDAGALPHQAMQRTGHGDMGMLPHYTHPDFGEILEDRLGFMQEEDEEKRS